MAPPYLELALGSRHFLESGLSRKVIIRGNRHRPIVPLFVINISAGSKFSSSVSIYKVSFSDLASVLVIKLAVEDVFAAQE